MALPPTGRPPVRRVLRSEITPFSQVRGPKHNSARCLQSRNDCRFEAVNRAATLDGRRTDYILGLACHIDFQLFIARTNRYFASCLPSERRLCTESEHREDFCVLESVVNPLLTSRLLRSPVLVLTLVLVLLASLHHIVWRFPRHQG
jgi:hypothetical protein